MSVRADSQPAVHGGAGCGGVHFRRQPEQGLGRVGLAALPSPARASLDERVPFEVVHYLPQAAETMKRLPGEFHQALLLLAERQKPDAPATVIALQPGDRKPHDDTPI
jgi:hypothetical protein